MIDLKKLFGQSTIYDINPMKTGFESNLEQPLVQKNTTTDNVPENVIITPSSNTPSVVLTSNDGSSIKAINPNIEQFYRIKPQLSSSVPVSSDVGYRNNNPGNLRDVSTGKFRKFNSLEDGWAALNDDFTIKTSGKSKVINKDASVKDFIYTYAPPSENDTATYFANVEKATGINPNSSITSLTSEQRFNLLKSIVKIESPNSYIYLFDNSKYRTVMASIKRSPKMKGGGILYTKHKNNYYEKN